MASTSKRRSHHYLSVLYIVLLALLLYAIVPQLTVFKQSIPLLKNATMHWLLLAVLISLGAHITAGFKYVALALRPIRVYPTVLVQLASLLVNRLLPIGIGGMGLNYFYLSKAKHSKLEAGVVITMNNIVGFVGHMLLVAVLFVFEPSAAHLHISKRLWVVAGIGLLLLIVLAIVTKQRSKKSFAALRRSLLQYRRRPAKIVAATLWSMVIAAFYAGCLWYCALALNVHITFLQAVVVLTLGVTASTVSPTPGGLVGVEAALVGALVVYKVEASQALAIALVYRLITYWFALLLGGIAFIMCRRQRYL